MKDNSVIEIIYISSNNKIITSNAEFKDNFTLQNLIDYMVKKKYIFKRFLITKVLWLLWRKNKPGLCYQKK